MNEPQWTMDHEETFRKVDADWYLETMFVEGDNDMAILSTQVLMGSWTSTTRASRTRSAMRSWSSARRTDSFRSAASTRALPTLLGRWTTRSRTWACADSSGTPAEWRGESRGWKANDPMVFQLYGLCIELGITNMHFHKGPAMEPLALEKFDVRDIDEPSTLYPELNFIVDHCGLPRLDDFCWLSGRRLNVYASLAVANMFLGHRARVR